MSNTQNTHISDMFFAKEKTVKDLVNNKNRTLSALFRDIRRSDSVLGIGDWPIMSMIVQEVSKFRTLTQKQVWLLCKQSKEYTKMTFGEKQKFSKVLWQSLSY